MIVDFLHSYYKMPCTLIIGGVPTNVTLRWFRAPAGAKQLPFPSAIFSHIWDNTDEADGDQVGEVGYPRTWDPGHNPGYQGQCYIGDPSWFRTGQLPALSTIPPPAGCVCQIAPAVGAGTLVLSGSATAFTGVSTCAQCPTGAPSKWTMTVSGGTGVFVAYNGTLVLAYQGGCAWHYTVSGYVWEVTYLFGSWEVRLQRSVTPVNHAFYTVSGAFSCLGPNPSWALSGSLGSGVPPTVAIVPGP